MRTEELEILPDELFLTKGKFDALVKSSFVTPIKDYNGDYYISRLGHVISTKYWGTDKIGVLKPRIDRYGYYYVVLSKQDVKRYHSIHRLIAENFIPNPNNLPIVNHKNEIKTDNKITNLEWCTHQYNVNYGDSKRKIAKKLSKEIAQIDKDGVIVQKFKSLSDAGREGYSISELSFCANGKKETYRGFYWQFI